MATSRNHGPAPSVDFEPANAKKTRSLESLELESCGIASEAEEEPAVPPKWPHSSRDCLICTRFSWENSACLESRTARRREDCLERSLSRLINRETAPPSLSYVHPAGDESAQCAGGRGVLSFIPCPSTMV